MEEEKNSLGSKLLEYLETIFGAFIMAVGIALFLLPNQLSSGGVAGIATITYYLFKIPMGTMILIINIPLFLISIYKIGTNFFIKSIIGTFSLSFFIDLLDKIEPLTNDRFLACVYGGIIIGLGTALILKANSSTGGSDLVSYVAKKYKPMLRTSDVIFIIDIIIVTLNMIFFGEIEIGLYSAITIYLMGKIIDVFFEGVYFTKLIIIVSEKSYEIAKEIENKVQRGITRIIWKGNVHRRRKISINVCSI